MTGHRVCGLSNPNVDVNGKRRSLKSEARQAEAGRSREATSETPQHAAWMTHPARHIGSATPRSWSAPGSNGPPPQCRHPEAHVRKPVRRGANDKAERDDPVAPSNPSRKSNCTPPAIPPAAQLEPPPSYLPISPQTRANPLPGAVRDNDRHGIPRTPRAIARKPPRK